MSYPQPDDSKKREEELQRAQIRERYLKLFFTPEARLRLNNVKLVKPEVAQAVEDRVIQLGTSGKITHPITDEELKALLGRFGEQRREFKIKYI
jgi:programmed cell death protein 5